MRERGDGCRGRRWGERRAGLGSQAVSVRQMAVRRQAGLTRASPAPGSCSCAIRKHLLPIVVAPACIEKGPSPSLAKAGKVYRGLLEYDPYEASEERACSCQDGTQRSERARRPKFSRDGAHRRKFAIRLSPVSQRPKRPCSQDDVRSAVLGSPRRVYALPMRIQV